MLSQRPLAFTGENHAHPTHLKTPGRALLKENVIRGPMTANAKGKTAQTPFHATLQPKTAAKAGTKLATVSRPLLDKTPFPNRVQPALKTPCPQKADHAPPAKLGVLAFADPAPAQTLGTPGTALRPSSTRKSLRAPRSAGKLALDFKTPVTRGNHWDVSDGDVSVGGAEVGAEERGAVLEEDYDEIEHMPPTAIERPYEPYFDMPDYKVAGAGLLRLARSHHFDDTADVYFGNDVDLQELDTDALLRESGFAGGTAWERLELPELEDDSPFARVSAPSEQSVAPPRSTAPLRTQPARSTRALAPALPTSSRPLTRASSRIASTSAAVASRPGTATSTMASTSITATTTRRPATRSTTAAARPATATVEARPVTRGAVAATRSVMRNAATEARPVARGTTGSTRAVTRQSTRAPEAVPPRRPVTGARGVKEPVSVRANEREDLVLVFENGPELDEDFVFEV
ncbi:hypothetical protein OBBRIDRAFT_888955 [Obba rivulosa]|uniref:Uncharacterized protein n=1 Tax=Obba rivulosa TaxID=1052685 RepID=A0A8E2B009_9APHY|nr:hypothetical protein OBBRIDRAFT_888955 [Obba rivulosa]